MTLSSNQKYVLASITVILLTVCADRFVFTTNATTDEPALEQKKEFIQTLAKAIQIAPKLSDVNSQKQPLAKFAFTNTVLPLPPTLEKPASRHILAPSSPLLEQNKQPVVAPQPIANHVPQAISTQAIDTQYAQLNQLDNASLRLAFPDNKQQTQQILRFMHNCIGISLGAYDVHEKTESRLTLLSGKEQSRNNQRFSAIMRLVSGYQTKKEKALMQAYAPNQQLARLYPKWFDYALSNNIATYLGTKPLTQFSGTYQLRGNVLILKGVVINNEAIGQNWSLAKISICGA